MIGHEKTRKENILLFSLVMLFVLIIFISCLLYPQQGQKYLSVEYLPEVGKVVQISKLSFVDAVASDHTKQFPGKLGFISNCSNKANILILPVG